MNLTPIHDSAENTLVEYRIPPSLRICRITMMTDGYQKYALVINSTTGRVFAVNNRGDTIPISDTDIIQNPELIDFPAFLKTSRIRLGLTQQRLSKKLGVSKQTIAFWEQGLRNPPADKKAKLMAILRGEK